MTVYQQPATPFVLEFLGATNYLGAQVVGSEGLWSPTREVRYCRYHREVMQARVWRDASAFELRTCR